MRQPIQDPTRTADVVERTLPVPPRLGAPHLDSVTTIGGQWPADRKWRAGCFDTQITDTLVVAHLSPRIDANLQRWFVASQGWPRPAWIIIARTQLTTKGGIFRGKGVRQEMP